MDLKEFLKDAQRFQMDAECNVTISVDKKDGKITMLYISTDRGFVCLYEGANDNLKKYVEFIVRLTNNKNNEDKKDI